MAPRQEAGLARPKIILFKPFQSFPDLAHAREAARCGAAVAGLIAVSYVALTALSLAGVKLLPELLETTDPGADAWANGVSLALAALAAGLAVVIQRRQPLWAALVVAVWGAAEIVFKLLLVAQVAETRGGNGGAVVGPMFMLVLTVLLLILAVRGALAMRRMRAP